MKRKILMIERKASRSVSIERVFRQIAAELSDDFDVEFQQVPFGNGVLAILGNLLFFRPRAADVYHITGDVHYVTMRLSRSRTVLTIHDLVFLRRRTGMRRAILKKLFLDIPLRRCAIVTAVSEATRAEIHAESRADFAVSVIDDPLIDGFCREPVKEFNANRPTILHIGTAPNKNLPRLLKALQGLECILVVVGKLAPDMHDAAARLGIQMVNKPALDEAEIVEEYRNADIVSYCSTYEGFGLPILEAQAMGKPVITSDRSPMNAVAGVGAILVDPDNSESIRQAIERVIADEGVRRELIDRGLENIRKYDPARIANEYAAVYRGVIEGKGK